MWLLIALSVAAILFAWVYISFRWFNEPLVQRMNWNKLPGISSMFLYEIKDDAFITITNPDMGSSKGIKITKTRADGVSNDQAVVVSGVKNTSMFADAIKMEHGQLSITDFGDSGEPVIILMRQNETIPLKKSLEVILIACLHDQGIAEQEEFLVLYGGTPDYAGTVRIMQSLEEKERNPRKKRVLSWIRKATDSLRRISGEKEDP